MSENFAHQFCLLLSLYIDINLEYLFVGDLMQVTNRRRRQTDHCCHVCYGLIDVVDVNLGGGHESTRKFISLIQSAVDSIEIGPRNRILKDDTPRVVDAPCSVQGDISVELQSAKIVNLVKGTPRRNKYFDTAAAERLDGFNRCLRNAVRFKTH